ncbi:ArsR family transcriptional regulator [Candidatus Lokiarchaeum ossiferum]|uniref:ArsR family transcriptional regulator n=1 Tax=Candidatus Lokiarchaeum ossiferum TaxID=2951803 RepID=UPI00352C9E44
MMQDTWKQVLADICHPTRLQILSIVQKSPSNFSNIATQVALSNSEVSRHLNRLFDQGVLEKDAKSRQISLTKYGALIHHSLVPLHFFCEFKHIFTKHDILDLPEFLLADLPLLKNAEFIKGTGPVMFKMQEITERAQKSLKMMVDQPFPFGKVGTSVEFIVPPSLMAMRDKIEKNSLTIDARLYDFVRYSICITDNGEALLFLPKNETNPDFESCFYVSSPQNPAFLFICQIWDHFWKNGKKIEEI